MENIVRFEDYNYLERKKIISRLREAYPILNVKSIGTSCAGREITAIKLGQASEYSLITAAFHGSERITSVILLYFIEKLCSAMSNDTSVAGLNAIRAMYGRGVIFVPCVNPDGCDIAKEGVYGCGALGNSVAKLCKNDFAHWNANLRGVDINHNFSAGWQDLREIERSNGIYGPGPTKFGGYKPESEPETLALTELCRTVKIRHVVALHTQGEVIYWNYGEKIPPRSKRMAEIFATTSGYALDVPTGTAVGGGFKDWFISEFDRPGFTFELGRGTNPLPISDAPKIYERIEETLMLTAMM